MREDRFGGGGFGGEYHVKMKLSGNRHKQAAYNEIISGMDRDYPLSPHKPTKICANCGGMIYHAARFQPYQLLAFAKQMSESDLLPGRLKLKIKRYCTKIVCERESARALRDKLAKEEKETKLCKS